MRSPDTRVRRNDTRSRLTGAALVATMALSPVFSSSAAADDGRLLAASRLGDPVAALEQASDAPDGPGGMSPKLRAMLLSLVVPGLGQYTSGNRTMGYVFFGVEAAIWATNIGLNLQGDSRSERYEEFANVWGGVENSGGHDDTYYTNLGRYPTYDEYRVVAERSEGPLYPVDMQWMWPNDERRNRYLDLRAAAEDSYQRAEFMFAAALLNRAVSMVHAARTVDAEPGHSLRFDVRPDGDDLVPLLAWHVRY